MRLWFLLAAIAILVANPAVTRAAELTDVIDAADGDDVIDVNLNVTFRSTLNRSKITHEFMRQWAQPGQSHWPDYNELRFDEQTYMMDYEIEVGLYHDVALYVNLPWIIQTKREIGFVSGVSADSNSTVYRNTAPYPEFRNATVDNPASGPSTERDGIGDMQIGVKWAVFNDERDDTKSVWIIGLDYTIPSGKLAKPNDVADDGKGNVGLGHHILTPFMLFSHRFSMLDPYIGVNASLPIQSRDAKDNGLCLPIYGGFLTGMEIIPWENKDKKQKFAIDLRLWTTFFSEVESKGYADAQGTVNEMSDFLVASEWNQDNKNLARQLQAQSQYTQFGVQLGFVFHAFDMFRMKFGVSLAHNTEHFITGAKFCDDKTGDGECEQQQDVTNYFRTVGNYDDPGQRLRVEETTLFTYWVSAMATF
ncbi:MAG: hypothetical protein JXR96_03905 [Deltaproteobacteria bacterium]|nr:hypothetical protein [Deltaproteobacteria bacterium]